MHESATIVDDDTLPTFTLDDAATVIEDTGVFATFNWSLKVISGRDISMPYQSDDDTARAGKDYTVISPTTLKISQGQLNGSISVAILDDVHVPHVSVRGGMRKSWPSIQVQRQTTPARTTGQYRLVAGTFHHSEAAVGDLVVDSEPEPIGVTEHHPFWSVDRNDLIPVRGLEAGKRVKTLDGTAKVVSYTMRDTPEDVYNLEVEDDHACG